MTSRLHELSARGVSVWIDSLSREMLETGELARLMAEDAVVGVTSNPTIFQKALASGERYDAQLRELAGAGVDDPTELFWALAVDDVLAACDLLRPVWERDRGRRRLRLARGRSHARLRPRAHLRGGDAPARARRAAEPARQDPGDAARPRRDRGLHRQGPLDQRHADLLARALRGGRRGLRARARAARRRGRRPGEGALRRQLLRLARGHRGRPAARRAREHGAAGQLAIANAKLAYAHFQATFAGGRWDYLAGKGAPPAAVPLGLDLRRRTRPTATWSTSRS